MKSIKEKAIEGYTGSVVFDYEYSKGFEEGANYVLGEIEQMIYEKHVEGNLPLFDLTHLIDKLKEE